MAHIDSYLYHAFDVTAEKLGIIDAPYTVYLAMLVQIKNPSWNVINVPDYTETARLGNIVTCIGTLHTVDALKNDPNVISVEASYGRSSYDCVRSIPFIRANSIHYGKIGEKGDQALIAIIDSDIDVLHEAFLDPTRRSTRILAVWDQNDKRGSGNKIVPYGRIHRQNEINQSIQAKNFPIGSGPGLIGNRNAHGTHVTSIAAGRSVPGSGFPGGVAPEANIIVVIPRLQAGPSDVYKFGYSESLIAALQYIDNFAQSLDLPVVVNLSQGINAGAHDGTSLIETAFDNFTGGGRTPGRVIIKSAGNERNKATHAYLNVSTNRSEHLRWYTAQSHGDLDVVELWFKACDEIQFCLQHPDGSRTPLINKTKSHVNGFFPSGNGYKISYVQFHQDNGDSCLTIVISQGNASAIELGTWTLEIQSNIIKSTGDIHAWLERNNHGSSYFLNHLSENVTVNIPGTAQSVISVGAVHTLTPFLLADYSSYGPTRDGRNKPDIVAPGEQIQAATFDPNTYTSLKVDSGTSMASAHVAGAIALLLSYYGKNHQRQLNAAQIRAALSQTAQQYSGRWTPGMGFGVLDVEALLRTFD